MIKKEVTNNASRGGKREGSGRKKQFNTPTLINFRCELEDKLKAKKKYGRGLNGIFVQWLKSIV